MVELALSKGLPANAEGLTDSAQPYGHQFTVIVHCLLMKAAVEQYQVMNILEGAEDIS